MNSIVIYHWLRPYIDLDNEYADILLWMSWLIKILNTSLGSYKNIINYTEQGINFLPVKSTIKIALTKPACPTIQPDLRNTITPKIFIRHDVNTPSQVPKRTGCDIKKLDFHHGTSPCNYIFFYFQLHRQWLLSV